jgi:predicted nucleic acid-binding protein
VALFYLDASALVKLVRDEPESAALRTFLADGELVSSELCLTEVPRAIRRASTYEPELPAAALLRRAAELFDALALLPLDGDLLATAGALAEQSLRSLDAIHLIAAVAVSPLDGFVSYEEGQSAAARLAGLHTLAPRGLSDGRYPLQAPRAQGSRSTYPTPRTVWISCRAPASSSFRRR